MRSKVLSYLLSLFLIFCVGFGSSLTAYAYNSDSFQFGNAWTFRTTSPNYTLQWQPVRNGSPIGTYIVSFDEGSKSYPLNNSAETNLSSLLFGSSATRFDFEFLQDLYDYYLVFNLYSFDVSSAFNFPLELVRFGYYDSGNTLVSTSDFTVVASGDRNDNGFTVICKIPDMPSAALNYFYLVGNFDIPSNLVVEGLFLSFEKDTDSDYVNSVISAINNQTGELGGKIDGAADDIQQSIEDQYSGEPGSSFPVDDIITQHNEKMGVLSFGSDTLMQVLGLLSPDQSLSSELVFPSMSLTVAGQRNKVQLWPEYIFDLNELKQHWPNFIGLMQSLTTALVWIFVLRYCYRVFEKYFLAGGGN